MVREDRIFYPEVDRVVEEKEKEPLLKLLTFTLEEFKDNEEDLPPSPTSP